VQRRAFCPYLTIEFKKDEETLATARYQVAVASAIALYNRYRLKNCALQMSGGKWSEGDMKPDAPLRHHIHWIRLGPVVHCAKPLKPGLVAACPPYTLATAASLPASKQLISIINDIHTGIGGPCSSCKADIAAKIHSDPDADTNGITCWRRINNTHCDSNIIIVKSSSPYGGEWSLWKTCFNLIHSDQNLM